MRIREFLPLLRAATGRVQEEINGQARDGGLYARGLSTEGFRGGYREALLDVEAMLTHGHPADDRNYWNKRIPR